MAPGISAPLTLHWKLGEFPPLTGVAVKVTKVPAHTDPADAAMEILTGRSGLTVIVTVFDVAGLPVGHTVLDISVQVTASLLAGL